MSHKLTPSEIRAAELQRVAIALHNELPGTPVCSTISNIGDDLRYWFRDTEWSIVSHVAGYSYTKIAKTDDPWLSQ